LSVNFFRKPIEGDARGRKPRQSFFQRFFRKIRPAELGFRRVEKLKLEVQCHHLPVSGENQPRPLHLFGASGGRLLLEFRRPLPVQSGALPRLHLHTPRRAA